MIQLEMGNALVRTVSGRGLTSEELAECAIDKIISVGDHAPPVIREQALAYKNSIREVLTYYMREAIKNDRATLTVKLQTAGHPELVYLLED